MKLNDFKNYKHTGGTCPSCNTQSVVLYDEFHGETFCPKCGLVLSSPARKSVVELIKFEAEKNK
ncbi:MAG: TFIIB-type zinc ribbon-containing protein [Methanobrevibacter sp.]|nr:TFIIB-type zinc ribbon-containing protein [Methanobrevibacter sp.]MBQ6627409.1 TFIIB-type zinc ribbon-containing protein [Methanobrevibacter sp.]